MAAQNQAAVGGACALNILRRLELSVLSMRQTPGSSSTPRQIVFSIVTEGPIHELWVHFQVDDAYHMTLLRIWRTTFPKEAKELVLAVAKILGWGVSNLRDAILEKLAIVENVLREQSRSHSSQP